MIINMIIALSLLLIGAIEDLRERKAHNILWLIMAITGLILLAIQPIDFLYIAFIGINILILYGIFQFLPIGGADVKALMAISVLLPYPAENSSMPPLYLIFLYSSGVTLALAPAVKIFHKKMTWKFIMIDYNFPYLVSILLGVVVFVLVGDIFNIFFRWLLLG